MTAVRTGAGDVLTEAAEDVRHLGGSANHAYRCGDSPTAAYLHLVGVLLGWEPDRVASALAYTIAAAALPKETTP